MRVPKTRKWAQNGPNPAPKKAKKKGRPSPPRGIWGGPRMGPPRRPPGGVQIEEKWPIFRYLTQLYNDKCKTFYKFAVELFLRDACIGAITISRVFIYFLSRRLPAQQGVLLISPRKESPSSL